MATSVFVGNIPWDVSEEQIKEILSQVGPVVSFRIVTDKENGKPKGYGFCEYKDEETALSAHRNLQGYEVRGRTLRVNFAQKDKKQSQATTAAAGNQTNQPPVAGDPIALHLAKLPRHHLIEVLSGFKAVALHNKEQARQLLQASPPLSRALLQALALLGLTPPPPPPAPLPPTPVDSGDRPSKKVRINDERALPNDAPLPSKPDNAALMPPQVQNALLQQVLRLKPEQLRSLPPHEQQQVIQIQRMYSQQTS